VHLGLKSNEEDNILNDLKKSGFPLEIHAGSMFSNRGWSVRHQAIFRDSSETKYIDLVATKSHWAGKGSFGRFNNLIVTIVCECKKSENRPWVFYTPHGSVSEPVVAFRYLKRVIDKLGFDINDLPLLSKSHYLTQEPKNRFAQANHPAYTRATKSSDSSEGHNQINYAINHVIKATLFHLQNPDPLAILLPSVLVLLYPLIVLDGSMYEYVLSEEGMPKVNKLSYLKYFATLAGPLQTWKSPEGIVTTASEEEFLIDIVTKDRLPHYLKWLDDEIQAITSSQSTLTVK